jgi:aspartyl-tRNA(Asn)/glutamyl-tRNA(Gln) amidotransferase subunit A
MNTTELSITQILEHFKSGSLSPVELMDNYLKNIEELNSEYNVYLFVRSREELLSEAKKAQEELKSGSIKKLLGIPFSLKDSYMALGTPTTAGDSYLKDTQSAYNATIVQRLLDEGAILVGKVNMDSWGFGSSTENSAYGVTRNPFDKERVAGGSSGGSAAAVALDMCAFSIGEDTGGSIRNPSNYCGTFGFKPTYGIVPRYGCISYGSSLDTVGPITRNAQDLELILDIIKGPDGNDMTTETLDIDKSNDSKKKFIYSMDYIPEGIDPEVRQSYLDCIEAFKKRGYEGVEYSFETLKYCIPTYYITAMSEASTNLSRYQGTRYGNFYNNSEKTINLSSWEDLFKQARTNGFGKEAKRRVFLGSYMLSEGYYDAYYKKAQKIRNLIFKELTEALNEGDFILSPVTPTPAPKIGENSSDPIQEYLGDIYTVTANLAGIPALSFPFSKNTQGLPIGMQIMGKKFEDFKLIESIKDLL